MNYKRLKLHITLLFLFFTNILNFAQTDNVDRQAEFTNAKRDMYAQFTQYSNILPILNPAYSGTTGELNMFVITRQQWAGQVEGAPISGAYNINGLIDKLNIGWGGSVLYEQYGAQRYFDISLATDYILEFNQEHNLSFGVQFSLNMYDFDETEFSAEEQTKLANNQEILKSGYKIPNVGFGLFYFTNKFYAGVSSPELMKYDEETGTNDFANVIFDLGSAVYFGYLGYGDVINEYLTYKATSLIKFSQNDKDFELNGVLTLKDKIGLGLGYRLNSSIIAMLEFNVFRGLDFGYSYDYPIQDTHIDWGAHEIRFNYSFQYEQVAIESSIRYW